MQFYSSGHLVMTLVDDNGIFYYIQYNTKKKFSKLLAHHALRSTMRAIARYCKIKLGFPLLHASTFYNMNL